MMLMGEDEGCWFVSLEADLKIPLKLSLRGDLGGESCWGVTVWWGKMGLILELEVRAGAERGLEGRLNGVQWKKLLVGLAERHWASPFLLPSFSARPGSPSRKGIPKTLRSFCSSVSRNQ